MRTAWSGYCDSCVAITHCGEAETNMCAPWWRNSFPITVPGSGRFQLSDLMLLSLNIRVWVRVSVTVTV